MLEFEIAAIYYFVAGIITAQPYFEEVPLDMLTPCVFYPTPRECCRQSWENGGRYRWWMKLESRLASTSG